MKLLQKIKIKKKMKENCELPFFFFEGKLSESFVL